MARQLRGDLQSKLKRFFDDAVRSRGTTGDPVLAVGSTVGPHRLDNEDRAAVCVVRFPFDRRPRLQLAIVCDGMGGLVEGGKAASEAIAAFISVIAMTDQPLNKTLLRAVQIANGAVHANLSGKGGTTLTAVVTDGREAWGANVGDSRLYSYGAEGLNLLTQDDTIQGAVHAHEGFGNEDELDNRLLQFIGIGESLTPSVFKVYAREGGLWIVTSDGAHGIGRKALEALLEGSRNANDIARRMVFVADALNVKDNASIAVMLQSDSFDYEPPSSGTTITISSPSRTLEIWLPEVVERSSELAFDEGSAESEQDHPVATDNRRPRTTATKKGKARRQSKAKGAGVKTGGQRPLEVLFESRKADDQPS